MNRERQGLYLRIQYHRKRQEIFIFICEATKVGRDNAPRFNARCKCTCPGHYGPLPGLCLIMSWYPVLFGWQTYFLFALHALYFEQTLTL